MMRQRGQSLLEYTILLIIIIAAFVTMQTYVKRGFQGRWKSAVDDMGEQYDPEQINSRITHTLKSSSNTRVKIVPASLDTDGKPEGYYTVRDDTSLTAETKNGYVLINGL